MKTSLRSCIFIIAIFLSPYPIIANDSEIPVRIAVKDWPGTKFTKVIAVVYDYTQEKDATDDYDKRNAVIEGNLHKGVFATSKPLTDAQIKFLFSAITDKDFVDNNVAKCFDPHHAFIFYDANDKIIGSLSICIGCNTFSHMPLGEFASDWKFSDLRKLFKELDMPILNKDSDYTDQYKKIMGQQAAPSNR